MSAAWGSPVQQAELTLTSVEVPSLARWTKPTSASFLTWWEAVDWLMPSSSASAPTVTPPAGAVATACSIRTRIGSARHANHEA